MKKYLKNYEGIELLTYVPTDGTPTYRKSFTCKIYTLIW